MLLVRWGQPFSFCAGVCVHASSKQREERDHERKNIPIKIAHKTIRLLCAYRPHGSDCTSHSSLFLPLASIASSLFWSLPFLLQASQLCVCFLLLSFFPSLPGYHLDFDLHHRHISFPFLVPPLLFACPPLPSYEPTSLFLRVSLNAYLLMIPHSKTYLVILFIFF